MSKILITGATGFIGKRLAFQLLEEGYEVYVLLRVRGMPFKLKDNPRLHVLYGDFRDPESLDPFPLDLDAAYYLVHSLASLVKNLAEDEAQAARNFVKAVEKTTCRQILFLGGIIENEEHLSPHLFSRLSVEKELRAGRIPATILRASIIIGSGSASFEIIRDLVEKLPVMIAPKWVKSYCQPIAIRDVLFYLTKCLLDSLCYDKTFDIGGPEAMTFKEALLRYAAFRRLKRIILDVPVLTPRLSSYWLLLITSVRFSICRYLVESMKHDTRKLNRSIDSILPHECIRYEEALKLAFQKIAQNEVVSTWMDAWDPDKIRGDITGYIEVPDEGCVKMSQSVPIGSPATVLKRVWSIGGENGWHSMDWAWAIRGFIDRLVGGAGMNRGRRHPTETHPGDSIDFWRVLAADQKLGRLILYAEMKMPGEAWLEFEIDSAKKILRQTATFRPQGFGGRVYWYLLWPIHWILFRNMARSIGRD